MILKETTMKRIIQAAVVASLLTGAQAALAFPSGGDDYIAPRVQSTYADRFAGEKAAPAMTFPSSGDEVMPVVSSTYADRHAGDIARAPMVFPAAGDDFILWAYISPRADQLATGASDPALSK
jgi:hypothetical protein